MISHAKNKVITSGDAHNKSAGEQGVETPKPLFSFWYEGKDGEAGRYVDAPSQEAADEIYKQQGN